MSTDWTTPDLGVTRAYSNLVDMYFRVLQYELAGEVFESIPPWLIQGTSIMIREELGLSLRFDFALEFWANQLELSMTSESGPHDRVLGEAYIGRLMEQSNPESYISFWRIINQNEDPEVAWQQAFFGAFGIGAEEFVDRTNKERRAAFSDVSGQLIGEGARLGSLLRISARSHLPMSLFEHHGTVSSDGTYSVTLPRNYPYELRIGLPRRSCTAFIGSDGMPVSEKEAKTMVADDQTQTGPQIALPEGFCLEDVAVRVTGSEMHIPEGLQLKACSIDGKMCSHMYGSFNGSYKATVSIPGPYIVNLTSDLHACPTYMATTGLSTDRALALPVDSSVNPTPAILHLDEGSQFCVLSIRGQFTGRPAEWLDGRVMRAYGSRGGSRSLASIDADGRFELPVPALGSYHFSLLGSTQHGSNLLPCSIYSEQDLQWLSRLSDPPLDAENDVVVESEAGTDLLWEIDPDACRHIVTGRIQSPTGEPLSDIDFRVCPYLGGLCRSLTSDRNGEFALVSDIAGDVVFSLQWGPLVSDPCQHEYWIDMRTRFTVNPMVPNQFVWTIPPNPCQ